MLKKIMTLCAALLALGFTFGTTSSASAHGWHHGYGGCCGPVAPIYHHRDMYKVVNQYVHHVVHKTEHFVRPRQVYYFNHLHVRTNVHVLTDVRIKRVGHIVDVPHWINTRSDTTHYTYHKRVTVQCVCGPHKRHCY